MVGIYARPQAGISGSDSIFDWCRPYAAGEVLADSSVRAIVAAGSGLGARLGGARDSRFAAPPSYRARELGFLRGGTLYGGQAGYGSVLYLVILKSRDSAGD